MIRYYEILMKIQLNSQKYKLKEHVHRTIKKTKSSQIYLNEANKKSHLTFESPPYQVDLNPSIILKSKNVKIHNNEISLKKSCPTCRWILKIINLIQHDIKGHHRYAIRFLKINIVQENEKYAIGYQNIFEIIR